MPTEAPVVAGSLTLSGISVAEASGEESKAVLQGAIADVAGVSKGDVTILGVAAAAAAAGSRPASSSTTKSS